MRRVARVLILLLTLLALSHPGLAAAQAPYLAGDPVAQTPARLVVFEAFMRST